MRSGGLPRPPGRRTLGGPARLATTRQRTWRRLAGPAPLLGGGRLDAPGWLPLRRRRAPGSDVPVEMSHEARPHPVRMILALDLSSSTSHFTTPWQDGVTEFVDWLTRGGVRKRGGVPVRIPTVFDQDEIAVVDFAYDARVRLSPVKLAELPASLPGPPDPPERPEGPARIHEVRAAIAAFPKPAGRQALVIVTDGDIVDVGSLRWWSGGPWIRSFIVTAHPARRHPVRRPRDEVPKPAPRDQPFPVYDIPELSLALARIYARLTRQRLQT